MATAKQQPKPPPLGSANPNVSKKLAANFRVYHKWSGNGARQYTSKTDMTILDVKNLILSEFRAQGRPSYATIDNIQIHEFDPIQKTANPVDDDTRVVASDASETFFASERHETVPPGVVLLRTVRVNQLEPWTYMHPKNDRTWTQRVPLFAATLMKPSEKKFPAVSASVDGSSFQVNGISLYEQGNETPIQDQDVKMPFDPLGQNEMKGETTMSFHQLEQQIRKIPNQDKHPECGVLVSRLTHDFDSTEDALERNKNPFETVEGSIVGCSKDEEKPRKKTPGLATKREVLYRFKLKPDTDLTEYGMALVFDKEDHWTLVRLNDSPVDRDWMFDSDFGVYIPGSMKNDMINNQHDKDAFDGVLSRIYDPQNAGTAPLTIQYKYGDRLPLSLPAVAAGLFFPHDMLLKASAEPKPPQQGQLAKSLSAMQQQQQQQPQQHVLEAGCPSGQTLQILISHAKSWVDEDQRQLYEACSVLYHFDPGYDVLKAIEKLESMDYCLEEFHGFDRSTLLEAMEGTLQETMAEGAAEDGEALSNGIEVLEQLTEDVDVLVDVDQLAAPGSS